MKRLLYLLIALAMCFTLVSCGEKIAQEELFDNSEYTDKTQDLPTIRDPDGTPTMPADKSLILLDHKEKHTSMTADEKLEILNSLKNMDIVSAFVVIDYSGWVSAAVDEEDNPQAFEEIVSYFAADDAEYELLQFDTAQHSEEYSLYVTFRDANGGEYTLFAQDYSVIHEDEIVGEYSNGSPMYAYTDYVAVCFDGDWFLLNREFVWFTVQQMDIKYTGHYN